MDECTPKIKQDFFDIAKQYKDLPWGAPFSLRKNSKVISNKNSNDKIAYDRIVYTTNRLF